MRLSIKSTMSKKKKSCSSNPGMSLPFKTSSTQLKNSEYTLSEIERMTHLIMIVVKWADYQLGLPCSSII